MQSVGWRNLAAVLVAALAWTAGCEAGADPETDPTAAATASAAASAVAAESMAATHEASGDYDWDAASAIEITLSDDRSSGGDGVSVDGSVVTVSAAGTYHVTGSLTNGQLAIDAGDATVRLVLDGVQITNPDGAAIAVLDADKAVVILADGSASTLADGSTYLFPSADVDEPNAALFSTADLSIGGEGALTVTGSYNDAIASKDGLVIASGSITVAAVDDGIRGKDYLVIEGGDLSVTAGGDGLKADNEEDESLGYVAISGGSIIIDAGTDAIEAVSTATVSGGSLQISAGDDGIHSEARLLISGGTIDITRSYEGLEGTEIAISDGLISVVSDDDGLNVAGGSAATTDGQGGFPGAAGGRGGGPAGETPIEGYFVTMSGGTLLIDAGGDGFDSNGSATISGGMIVVNGPTSNGDGALDVNGTFLVSGGTLVAVGSAGMAEAPDRASEQAFISVVFNTTQPAGTVVRVEASDGEAVLTFASSKPFQSLVLSNPSLESGATYDVLVGGTAAGESLGGLYLDGSYSAGTVLGTVTAA